MKQRIFTKAYISKLSGELDDATANIIHSGIFVPEDYCDGVATTLETHIDAPEGLGTMIMDMSLADASIAIYKSFQSLTPAEASRNYLWTYLALTDLYGFMRVQCKTAKTVGAVRDNWFTNDMIRHGLAKLWWMVYLTQDASKNDDVERFALTRYFLADNHADLRLVLSQSALFRCTEFTKGILSYLKDNDSIFADNFQSVGRYIVSYFNKKGGTVQLATLTWVDFYNEIEALKPVLLSL